MGFARLVARLCLACDDAFAGDEYDLGNADDLDSVLLEKYGSQRAQSRARGRTPRSGGTSGRSRSRSHSKGRKNGRGRSEEARSTSYSNEGLHKEDNFFFGTIEMDSDVTVSSSLSGSADNASYKSSHSSYDKKDGIFRSSQYHVPMKMPANGTKFSMAKYHGVKYPSNTSQEGVTSIAHDANLYNYRRASTEPIPILKSPKSVTFEEEDDIECSTSQKASVRSEKSNAYGTKSISQTSMQATVSLSPKKPPSRDAMSARRSSFQKVRSSPASSLQKGFFRKGGQPNPVTILEPSQKESVRSTPRSQAGEGWKLTNRRAMKGKGSQNSRKKRGPLTGSPLGFSCYTPSKPMILIKK